MARGREAEEHRGRLAACGRADEEPVLSTNGDPLHLTFGHVVVDRQRAGLGITD